MKRSMKNIRMLVLGLAVAGMMTACGNNNGNGGEAHTNADGTEMHDDDAGHTESGKGSTKEMIMGSTYMVTQIELKKYPDVTVQDCDKELRLTFTEEDAGEKVSGQQGWKMTMAPGEQKCDWWLDIYGNAKYTFYPDDENKMYISKINVAGKNYSGTVDVKEVSEDKLVLSGMNGDYVWTMKKVN